MDFSKDDEQPRYVWHTRPSMPAATLKKEQEKQQESPEQQQQHKLNENSSVELAF